MVQTAAHTKAAGTEEVLRRMEKELREKLKVEKTENQSLNQKVYYTSTTKVYITIYNNYWNVH